MAHGDCQHAFARAAAEENGIVLMAQSFEWLSERGHLALPREAADAVAVLERIYTALGGDIDVLATARRNRLRGVLLHEPSGTLIEVDEHQHFTSFRAMSLGLYPAEVSLGFDREAYVALCREWQHTADGYRRARAARGFGVGGRQRQRAYYDAVRDLATPAMGHPPLIRIDAPDDDGAGAYRRHRQRLLELLE
jgi:hypothetical protein